MTLYPAIVEKDMVFKKVVDFCSISECSFKTAFGDTAPKQRIYKLYVKHCCA